MKLYSDRAGGLIRRWKCTRGLSPSAHTWRKGKKAHRDKVVIDKPRGEPSPETEFAGTLIMDFQPLKQ